MKKAIAGSLCFLLSFAPASSAEWWQDAFLSDQSTTACLTSDTRVTFTANAVHYWEQPGCPIKRTTALKGLDGVILDMSCPQEDGTRTAERQLLLRLGNGKIASFPPLQVLKRCDAVNLSQPQSTPGSQPRAASGTDCPFNSRLYRSPLYEDTNAASFQELRFTDGDTQGNVMLTEQRAGKQVWAAHGEFTCSNGFSICSVTFPLAPRGDVELPYETTGDINASSETVVIPAFRQEAYQTGQSADPAKGEHGGLVADLLGGFTPTDDEVIAPYNSYRYADCAR
ncbi:hypothetical protein EN852_001610 [Mesorhizobium sp. M2E.F.Ca.ET.209.01.1.1]|uniref:hypothetical protein n=1 Tax=Mesorhizobium sp. M2E.F.Ca.ET.209.01.1.1 TaxID=2500526 RepID=UPI000FD8A8F8|nr:hypothetical protein [Mesorhizobium sp. M2E.F.Ca.ET.209.01.1.1]TGS19048.1 hypothetical protein EN852_001610 [Mesorhizobium sp. M2E.F.Ca.ET.209.01.1.1]